METYDNIRLPWPDWKITRHLGSGAYGKVYEIERNIAGIQEEAALKIISRPTDSSEIDSCFDNGYDKASLIESYEKEIQNYVQEYKLMKELQGQSNIVSCDDFAVVPHEDGIGGDIFLRMELLTSLPQVLRQKQLSEQEIIKLGKDIARALMLCESKNIIHRDIKPLNIMVSKFGDYKLGDFGVSRIMEHATYATMMGTPEYQAPEVVHMEKYGKAADIYSLGITLYWLLNNRKMPFIGADERFTPAIKSEATKRRYRGEQLPPPRDGSAELKQIVLKACAYRPQDRYTSAGEIYQVLERLNSGQADHSIENLSKDTHAGYLLEDVSEKEKIHLVWPNWELIKYLGSGTHGKVYEIQRNVSGIQEKAALKIVSRPKDSDEIDACFDDGYDKTSIIESYEEEIQSYIQAYKLVKELQGQSNIVSYNDFAFVPHADGIGGDIFLRMELLLPLPKMLGKENRETINDEFTVKLGKDICQALILCEKKKIVHRNIKPWNIYLTENGRFKLGGFDVAKKIENPVCGTIMGTPQYMAPEMVHMEEYGKTVDIYSLGITLYWLLNNQKLPFVGENEELTPAIKSEAADRRYRGEQLPPPRDGSAELKQIVLKACAYRPQDRYTSAEEMYWDLEKLSSKRNENNTVSSPMDSYVGGFEADDQFDNETIGYKTADFQGNETISEDSSIIENESTMGNSWGNPQGTIGRPGNAAKKNIAEYETTIGKRPSRKEKTMEEKTPSKNDASSMADTISKELPPGIFDHVMDWKDTVLETKMRTITGISDRAIMLRDVYHLTSLDLLKEDILDKNGKIRRINNYEALLELAQLQELRFDKKGTYSSASAKRLFKELPNLKKVEVEDKLLCLDTVDFTTPCRLTELVYDVSMGTKLKFFKYMPDLETLDLNGVNLNPLFGSKNVQGMITGLPKLKKFRLSSFETSDVSFLASMTRLEELSLRFSKIKDIAILKSMTELKKLQLWSDYVSNLEPLEYLPNLAELDIQYCPMIQDVSVLRTLPQLKKLRLKCSDLSFIRFLPELEDLKADSGHIRDLSPLQNLTKLKNLSLSGEFSDLMPLRNLSNLRYLYINSPAIQDVSLLNTLPNLIYIGTGQKCSESICQQCEEIRKRREDEERKRREDIEEWDIDKWYEDMMKALESIGTDRTEDKERTRIDGDLHIEQWILKSTAIKGGMARISLGDKCYDLQIPAGTSEGKTFCLRGCGDSRKDGGGVGDLFVRVHIIS